VEFRVGATSGSGVCGARGRGGEFVAGVYKEKLDRFVCLQISVSDCLHSSYPGPSTLLTLI